MLAVLLLSEAQQVPIILLSQVANGVLLPFVVIFMLQLTNRADVMGPYRNSRLFNIIAWTTCIVMIILTVMWAASSFIPGHLTG
jgi:Mn2+/Fe2+ NRAMP family transporter